MKAILKPVFVAGMLLAAASPLALAPASAQVVAGLGTVDPGVIIGSSSAYKTAEAQRPVTYAQYYEQARTRNTQIDGQLKPLYDKLEADSQAPNANREALSQQVAAIRQIEQQGQRELSQILQPVGMSQEYVDEQIAEALPKAVEAVAKRRNITLVFTRSSNAILYRDAAYNLNTDVIAELDRILPTAQLSPPPGWLPREAREQQAAIAAQQAVAQQQGAAAPATGAAPAPAGPQPESR